MMQFYSCILIVLTLCMGCRKSEKNSYDPSLARTSEYATPSESFKIKNGLVRFDTSSISLTTHMLDSGPNRAFIYKRSGVTLIDASDYEAKYTETLIFQIDSTITEFEYCDSELKLIDCKYYWICYTKELKKEIRDVKKGCIKVHCSSDSVMIKIDVNSEFGFGGLLEKDEDRIIRFEL